MTDADEIHVTITDAGGEPILELSLSGLTTIREVKQSIQVMEGTPCCQQHLFLKGGEGEELLPGATLLSSGLDGHGELLILRSSASTRSWEGRLRCVVRVRPLRPGENRIVEMMEYDTAGGVQENAVVIAGTTPDRHSRFNDIFAENSSQEDVFQALGDPALESVLSGCTSFFIAYGQSGSGKSHTLCGNEHDKGLLQRFTSCLFAGLRRSGGLQQHVCCSFLEVHLNTVWDLLSTGGPAPLNVFLPHNATSPSIPGLSVVKATSAEEMEALFNAGEQRRASSNTSASTVIFRMALEQLGGSGKKSWGKLVLVDLCSSSRSRPGMTEVQRSEGIANNASLTSLGAALHDALHGGQNLRVRARDSKLTVLLFELLSGRGSGTLIGNISPAESDREETISTLRMVSRLCLLA
eukprot:TRINITY_DN61840_c0_g1_i1.p1 TRINITY_DN61840_c0_g1~~TRINITY_DN61840_c0_g1_i1.p1  ORF type:complete len:436 (+),score=42.34 TRINITY_DN61840_c0_g1_i1:80-1309(+)